MTTLTPERPARSHAEPLSAVGTAPATTAELPRRRPADRRDPRRRRPRPAIGALPVLRVPAWKRGLDLALIAISLPLAIPLLLAVALWIRLVSRGPALFRQERIGHGEKSFTILKFRTMHEGAATRDHELHVARLVESDRPMVKLDEIGDGRLIPGGCLLRTTGLDELPQLINVLRGEMSLVGPRPCVAAELRFFTVAQRERFRVLPGLTGLWQVSGKNRRTFREMNALDVAYTRHLSPSFDLLILLRTPAALLREMAHCFRRHVLAAGQIGPLAGFGGRKVGDRP
jgi:lipopolysaccharide/colanic/teichoic acid biosynthesis glycosyltransferase